MRKNEKQEKRHSQQSDGYYAQKMDGVLIVTACLRCSRFDLVRCKDTGEEIKFPFSGPVGMQCPLPGYEEADKRKCVDA
jgi:hypothetical protein